MRLQGRTLPACQAVLKELPHFLETEHFTEGQVFPLIICTAQLRASLSSSDVWSELHAFSAIQTARDTTLGEPCINS